MSSLQQVAQPKQCILSGIPVFAWSLLQPAVRRRLQKAGLCSADAKQLHPGELAELSGTELCPEQAYHFIRIFQAPGENNLVSASFALFSHRLHGERVSTAFC